MKKFGLAVLICLSWLGVCAWNTVTGEDAQTVNAAEQTAGGAVPTVGTANGTADGTVNETVWTMGEASSWGRTPGAISMKEENAPERGHVVRRVDYSSTNDWGITPASKPIPAQPGEAWEISCAVKTQGNGCRAQTGVILYGPQNEVISWIYGGESLDGTSDWKVLTSRFIVGRNVVAFQPRFTGSGAGSFWFDQYTLRKVDQLAIETEDRLLTLENQVLKCAFHTTTGAVDVTDKRTGRVWKQTSDRNGMFVQNPQLDQATQTLRCQLVRASQEPLDVTFQLEGDKPELVFTLDCANRQTKLANLAYPYPIQSNPGDRVIVPMNEGISYPAEEPNIHLNLVTYGGHGICMAFWGMMEDVTDQREKPGASCMAICETADDARLQVAPNHPGQKNTLLEVGPLWEAQRGQLGYARRLRWVFFDGSEATQPHVTICKRYREYAKQKGLWVPFTEKQRRNPALREGFDLLIGSVNVWFMGGKFSGVELVKQMQAAGIERILWSGGGSAEALAQFNAMPGVLTSRYDIYQDIMNPERAPELGHWHDGWIREAWPNDLMLNKNGDWTKGWGVTPKDASQPRIPCGVLCDSKAPQYARKRIGEELKTKPYKARFLDTTTASPWRECYHPDHPLTRTESRIWKMRLLELIGSEFNLVCGSETGHDASVPYCDFYEGMMSLGNYRVPDSGRDMVRIWDEVPEWVAKFQLGESYRLPLWELVYHDCTVSYWYWGDYNNKLPSLWDKRDLFNALYGVPPMFLFTGDYWEKNRERFVQSYRVATPVARLTGYSEMTDHRILNRERTVQQTVFANGTVVTVNFGAEDFALPDGQTIPAGQSVVTTPQQEMP